MKFRKRTLKRTNDNLARLRMKTHTHKPLPEVIYAMFDRVLEGKPILKEIVGDALGMFMAHKLFNEIYLENKS